MSTAENTETYVDHIARLASEVRDQIREGHAETQGHIPDVIEWVCAESPWIAMMGEEQVELDVMEQLDDVTMDEDAFDLLCASGGIEANISALVEFFEIDPDPWFYVLDNVDWVWRDPESGVWHGPERAGVMLAPVDDQQAIELIRIVRTLDVCWC